MQTQREVIVVGGGPAGISSALCLKDLGLSPLVLERSDRIASSWRGRYDRLTLNTNRKYSHLPGRPFPEGTPTFPTRDQVVEHLERHASEDGIDMRLGVPVERIDRDGDGWLLRTPEGDFSAPEVIVATGYENQPHIPEWEGRDEFRGEVLHAAEYRNPEPYRGREVLVVGPGCSGMEIAYDLVEGGAAKVRLAVRTPPNIVLRTGPGGVPGDVIAVKLYRAPIKFADAFARLGRKKAVGDLSEYGLPIPEEGVFSRVRKLGVAPAIIDPEVVEAIRERRIEIVAAVESFDRSGVHLADGSRLEPDAVISATGYRRALEPMVGHLGILGRHGAPKAVAPEPVAEGLRFVGYVPRPAGLRYMAKEARRAAKAIRRELRRGAAAAPREAAIASTRIG